MKIEAVDLFCGAGGTSSGLYEAADDLSLDVNLLAVNHWEVAIATHSKNHKAARHMCVSLDTVDPRKHVPGGRLHLLVASPECTHHSNARGGRPMNDQSRASAWHILRWVELLKVDNILLENVREFANWGPLGANGRPIKSRKGETFQAFIQALRSFGYTVDYRILNAADYGDATTRERLFILARKGRRGIAWPTPTHAKDPSVGLFGKLKPWRAAREIIDWSIPGKSIFERKTPLSENTMRRIEAGLRKFSGPGLEPYLVIFRGKNRARSLDRPAPTITAGGKHFGLCEPFIVPLNRTKDQPRSTKDPLKTVTATSNDMGLVEPFLVKYYGTGQANSVNEPLDTVTAKDRFALCAPFIIGAGGPTGAGNPQSVEQPLNTVLGENHKALVQPFVVGITQTHAGDKRVRSIDKPLPTVVTKQEFALVEPFICEYHSDKNSKPRVRSVKEPLPTVDCANRFGLAEPVATGARLDIRFRMLQPHELAAAQSFNKDYQFTGTREEQVKQIGNAVPTQLARALCRAALSQYKGEK